MSDVKCSPHTWDVDNWMSPVIASGKIPMDHPCRTTREINCVECGRTIDILDLSDVAKSQIAKGIAKRIYNGDEESEVSEHISAVFYLMTEYAYSCR